MGYKKRAERILAHGFERFSLAFVANLQHTFENSQLDKSLISPRASERAHARISSESVSSNSSNDDSNEWFVALYQPTITERMLPGARDGQFHPFWTFFSQLTYSLPGTTWFLYKCQREPSPLPLVRLNTRIGRPKIRPGENLSAPLNGMFRNVASLWMYWFDAGLKRGAVCAFLCFVLKLPCAPFLCDKETLRSAPFSRLRCLI